MHKYNRMIDIYLRHKSIFRNQRRNSVLVWHQFVLGCEGSIFVGTDFKCTFEQVIS